MYIGKMMMYAVVYLHLTRNEFCKNELFIYDQYLIDTKKYLDFSILTIIYVD